MKKSKKVGRKTSEVEKRTRRNVSLSDSSVELLSKYGSGNVSEGIRLGALALERMGTCPTCGRSYND